MITSLFPQVLLARLAKVHHMALVACQPAVVEQGYHAGTCWICGETYPRPGASLSDSLPASGVKRKRSSNQVASPAMSRHSSRVSESGSSCEQSAVGVQSVQPVIEGKTNDALGSCAPSKSNLSVESTGSCGTKLFFLQKKQELYPSCTKVSLCPRWMDQEPTPL